MGMFSSSDILSCHVSDTRNGFRKTLLSLLLRRGSRGGAQDVGRVIHFSSSWSALASSDRNFGSMVYMALVNPSTVGSSSTMAATSERYRSANSLAVNPALHAAGAAMLPWLWARVGNHPIPV